MNAKIDGCEVDCPNDFELIKSGEMNPEPLFLRANVGDLVKVRLRNELDMIEMHGEEAPFDTARLEMQRNVGPGEGTKRRKCAFLSLEDSVEDSGGENMGAMLW